MSTISIAELEGVRATVPWVDLRSTEDREWVAREAAAREARVRLFAWRRSRLLDLWSGVPLTEPLPPRERPANPMAAIMKRLTLVSRRLEKEDELGENL